MLAGDFIELYPQLFHMTEAGAWPTVCRFGLLSAQALVELFEVPEPRRTRLISQRRERAEKLEHPAHGTAVLRDQAPMSEAKLRACLTDLEPTQWYQLLNRRVFLWPSGEKLRCIEAIASASWH